MASMSEMRKLRLSWSLLDCLSVFVFGFVEISMF